MKRDRELEKVGTSRRGSSGYVVTLSQVVADQMSNRAPRKQKSKWVTAVDKMNPSKLPSFALYITLDGKNGKVGEFKTSAEAEKVRRMLVKKYGTRLERNNVWKSSVDREEDYYNWQTKLPNPSNVDIREAEKVSQEWHGRKSREILEVDEVEQYEDTLVALAELEELGILGSELDQWTISFKVNRPTLTADIKKKNLEFVGGDQKLKFDGLDGKREVPLGYCYQIVYETDKHHLEGSNGYSESYEHFFGEEFYKKQGYSVEDYKTSDRFFEEILADGVVEKALAGGYLPIVVYDSVNEKIRLVGGKYDIRDVGIVD